MIYFVIGAIGLILVIFFVIHTDIKNNIQQSKIMNIVYLAGVIIILFALMLSSIERDILLKKCYENNVTMDDSFYKDYVILQKIKAYEKKLKVNK